MSFEKEFKLEHAWVEFRDRLQMIAERRGLTLSQVTQEALENFVAEDFAQPRGTQDDIKLGLPAGKPILEEVKLHRYSMFVWPDADDCPDHLLEAWLEMIHGDINNIRHMLDKEKIEAEKVFEKYAAMKTRLKKRVEARDKCEQSSEPDQE